MSPDHPDLFGGGAFLASRLAPDGLGLVSAAPGVHTSAQLGAEFGAAAVCMLLAAFLVSVEVALTRTTRIGVDELVRHGRASARRLEAIAEDPVRYLNMVLLLRVGCEVLAALLLVVGFIGWLGFGWPAVTISAVVMITISYALIGVTPRILGRQFPETVALAGATVIYPITKVLGPLAQLLVLLGRAFTPKGRGDREGPFASEDELRHFVDLAEERQLIDAQERQMIHSVFQLDDTMVREVMVPRTDIVFIGGDASVEEALSVALRSGFSRIPVAGENVDDIVGIVYLKDMVAWLRDRWGEDGNAEGPSGGGEGAGRRKVTTIMRGATYVPDSKPIDELLREMQRQRIHMAVVIDEYGGTAGLVSIEDIVEEIVGEITDEYDDEVPPFVWLDDGRARVTARLPIAELAEAFDVRIDTEQVGEVGTVGGLLAYALGQVPVAGSAAVYAGLSLTAEGAKGRQSRPATILVRRIPEPADEAERSRSQA